MPIVKNACNMTCIEYLYTGTSMRPAIPRPAAKPDVIPSRVPMEIRNELESVVGADTMLDFIVSKFPPSVKLVFSMRNPHSLRIVVSSLFYVNASDLEHIRAFCTDYVREIIISCSDMDKEKTGIIVSIEMDFSGKKKKKEHEYKRKHDLKFSLPIEHREGLTKTDIVSIDRICTEIKNLHPLDIMPAIMFAFRNDKNTFAIHVYNFPFVNFIALSKLLGQYVEAYFEVKPVKPHEQAMFDDHYVIPYQKLVYVFCVSVRLEEK